MTAWHQYWHIYGYFLAWILISVIVERCARRREGRDD